jgi:superfamily II DNA or RNA helicase
MARILLPPVPVSWSLQVETGIGKTATAVRATAEAVKAGVNVVYCVPRHDLGDELVHRFRGKVPPPRFTVVMGPTIPTPKVRRCVSTYRQ